MKRCPTCNRTYSDEQVSCADDGTILVSGTAQSDSAATPAAGGEPGSTPPPQTQAYDSNVAPGYEPPTPPGMFSPPPPGGPTTSEPVSKLPPAIIGGVVLGVLAIGTFLIPLRMVNWCCCLWGLAGGALAVFLYVKRSPTPVRPGDGAILGLLAGAIGAVIFMLIAFPVIYFALDPEVVQAQFEEQMRQSGSHFDLRPYWVWFLLLTVFLFGGMLTILSLIGGLIGVPIFERRKSVAAPPPPPPSFDGSQL